MSLVTGAMSSLLPKLAELLNDKYKLQKGVKEGVRSLEKEMKSIHAALCKVAEVPRDQLTEEVKLWAGEMRELSFVIEDVIDKFLVRADDGSKPTANSKAVKSIIEKMVGLFTKGKARHEIADAIKDINKQVQEVANRRGRYTINDIIAKPAAVTPINPRLGALYQDVTELVGIAGKRDQELMKLLSNGDSMSKKKLKIVSVVGFGGVGKTTLVKTVYNQMKGDFDCSAFVAVGRNAGANKVLMDILLDLGMYESQFTILDERQLINKLRKSLENKRYLIVLDDIWDEKLWGLINWAFSSGNNFSSRIITTTRIVSVSKLCSSSPDDSVYQMEPLSDEDSQRLFYKRIFSRESGCPHELEVLSMNILKKCGGVPLAIITVASLLVRDHQVKQEDEWHVLLESIGRGLTDDPSVEEMLRILSFSYYDLPSHLKTCLLYLSMFPEDYEIRKDRLIWMWIAESFVQCEKVETCPFEIGESYFNELVNRNMIMPVYGDDGILVACNVHDMVLDLISSLSSEDNFVTILNYTCDSMSSQSNDRRLSLQNCRKGELQTRPLESVSMLQVRSIATFQHAIGLMPSFSSFVVLRVLDLNGCNISGHNHLNLRDLGSLLHLKYLGLAQTGISEVPEEVGKLQFLQVLDVSRNDDMELPSTIIKLRRLMCLLIDYDHKRLPDGLGNLISMEVLSEIHGDSLSTVKELGNMERLRKLEIRFYNNLSLELKNALVRSLGKMPNIQSLRIEYRAHVFEPMILLEERWVPPRSLQEFVTIGMIKFSRMPAWIKRNPVHMLQLSKLQITVDEVRQEDLDNLGRLPALRILDLWSLRQSRLLLVGADGFRCLTSFKLQSWSSPGQVVFMPGAMPNAERVVLRISLQVAKEEAAGNGGDRFDLGMSNLPSLRKVDAKLFRSGVTVGEARQAEVALENALGSHPNRPTFGIDFVPDIPQYAGDDDVCSKYDVSD
ncbi:hypothetical protein QYE76_019142 [Lolium multiflorum]|uniref:Uncharacterized protein n=1 Tax=Lolium multiflorum TaxID=4521 RepID=A0AAD8VQQ0_LOLMU|nr:hypothetical protein QYE76_019142 [Lolium multiflorum]